VAISWKRAVEVAVDEAITSTQLATLATAFNDRLRSGIGDGSWRIFFWWLSLFRQVRNSDETGFSFPSMGEYFELYQHLDPRDAIWPLTGPGDPEGANVACQMNAFVFGGSAFQLNDEAERFALMAWPQTEPNPREAWDHAKQQRGGYDPQTGGVASPALAIAQEHYRIRYGMKSPHGLSYGGWLPQPDLGTPCVDPDYGDGDDPNPNYLIKFTSLEDGSSITFAGTCAPAGEDFPYDDHVAFVARMPWAFYVFLNDGSLYIFPSHQWVEGPYTGEGVLQKAENGAIGRVLNNFVREFRGAHEDRKSQKYHLQHAFDFQKFFTSQYHLAPQRGIEIGGFVDPIYPTAKSEGVPAAGSFLIWDDTSTTTRGWHDGFVLTGFLIEIEGMSGFVNVEILDEEQVIDVVTIVPDETGRGSELRMVETAWAPAVLEFRIKDVPADVDGSSVIKVECTELWSYKPTVEDAYVILRASATLPTEPDGVGDNETDADILSDDYFDFGCIINRAGQPGLRGNFAEVNTNAVFDATRRWSKMVRLIRRQEFVGYAVEGGKSVLYFKRFAFGLHNNIPADIFDGIGPSREQLVKGGIEPGYVYENRADDSIDYNGATIKTGERFTGVAGVPAWEGEGEVFEADGIRHTAPPNGYTNEWLIGFEFKGYHTSYSSLWKTDAYSDYFTLSNRCMFYAPEVATDPALLLHTSFNERVGGDGTVAPEAPSSFNYTMLAEPWLTNDHTHLNQYFCDEGDTDCEQLRRDFYASCRVYEPDPEIEKCEVESSDGGGNEIIKITLKTRLHHCSGAPSSIDKDPSTWDIGALESEPFRSTENALRQYIIHQTTGRQCDWEIPGNTGINSTLYAETDAPFGTCFPHFRLVKLVPLPYDDGNNKQNPTDTRFEHDFFPMMELYLKCMCEGFIDGVTSAAHACEYGTFSAFDFTFTNLCVQAFGNKWFSTLRREDQVLNPQGYGPMPNTEAYAEVFNQFAKAINLLTTFRVNIPAKLQCRLSTSESFSSLGMKNAGGEDQGCSNGILAAWGFGTFGGGGGSTSHGTWDDCAGGLGAVTAGANPTGVCDGSAFEIKSSRTSIGFRWIPLDPDALTYALPAEWSDMLVSDATVMATVVYSTSVLNKTTSTDPSQGGSTQCCPDSGGDCPAFIVSPGVYLNFDGPTTADPQGCQLFIGGFGPPAVPASHLFYVQGPDPTPCPSGPSSQTEYVILTTTIPMVTVPLH
jgi:hypothetical protein